MNLREDAIHSFDDLQPHRATAIMFAVQSSFMTMSRFGFIMLVVAGCGGSQSSNSSSAQHAATSGHESVGDNGAADGNDSGTTAQINDIGDAGFGEDTGAMVAAPVDAGSSVQVAMERFPIVPLHLVAAPGATGEDAHVDLELRADGTLYSHGHLIGQVAGERVVAIDGREILSVSPEGSVLLHGTTTQIHVRESGEIALPNGAILSFADDGAPLVTLENQPPRRGPSILQGYRPDARRTAGLLALIVATVSLPR